MSDEPKRELLPGEAEADAWIDTLEQRADAMSDDIEDIKIGGISASEYIRGIKNGNIDPTYDNAIDALLWAADEIERLRKAIQNYLDGNWGTRLPRKIDKCPHDRFGWEDCGNCIDEYFAGVLRPSEG